MRKTVGSLAFGLIAISGYACAQAVQNMDAYYGFGGHSVNSQTIPGTGVTVSGETTLTFSWDYGYQIKRFSAASLWLEVLDATHTGTLRSNAASIPGPIDYSWYAYVPGVRFMVPLRPRISVFGVAGMGVGASHYPVVVAAPLPYVDSNSTFHGVFEFGVGADIRISRWISIRGDVRDFVTGQGLDGVAGRQRVLPTLGLALHF